MGKKYVLHIILSENENNCAFVRRLKSMFWWQKKYALHKFLSEKSKVVHWIEGQKSMFWW